jgi:hypothetical protein
MIKRIKASENFYIDEFVSREFYNKWGSRSIHWIRPELINILQFIRNRYGVPMIINNWATGGNFEQSGLRYPTAAIGAGDSLHKFGCAADPKFKDQEPEFYNEVRNDIIINWESIFKKLGLTTIEENTKTWLHLDVRHIPDQYKIFIIYP